MRNTTGLYCGRRCAWLARGGAEFNARVAKKSAARRGDLQRDSGEQKTYRKLNGRHEHRVVVESVLGRSLTFAEIVHHKDGDIRNNSISNLEVLTRVEHMRKHGLGIPGAALPHEPWKARVKK